MTYKNKITSIIFLLLAGATTASAVIRLGAPFGEHMVLQQGVPVPIWGTGCPGGDTVNVSFAGQNLTASSDWAGRWMVVLAPMKAGGPYQLLIQIGGTGPLVQSPAANSRGGVELNDVVVGEVKVFQSQIDASQIDAQLKNNAPHIADAQSAWVRVYKAPKQTAGERQSTGGWTVAPPPSASYSFGREMYDKLRLPIGVIESSAGP